MAITYTLMKLLRVKLLLRRKVLDVTTIRLENGCRNMQENMIFNLYLTTNSKVQKKKKKKKRNMNQWKVITNTEINTRTYGQVMSDK